MADYPKRLYLPGKLAVTVKNAEEEETWVHPPAPPAPIAEPDAELTTTDAAPLAAPAAESEPEPAADAAPMPAPIAEPEP